MLILLLTELTLVIIFLLIIEKTYSMRVSYNLSHIMCGSILVVLNIIFFYSLGKTTV